MARQFLGPQTKPTDIMATACNPSKIVAALYEETENITDFVRERISDSDRLALRMVPDGGTVRRNANNDTIIYGEARQAGVAYNQLDHAERALVSGEMSGRDLNAQNGIFATDINSIDDNACHGQVTIDFAQGFRRRTTVDYGLDVDTPIKCARELDRLGEQHIRGYFRGMNEQFSRFGLDNFSDNLMNLIIQRSEANASVLAADEFNVSTGGWQAPPAYRISIHFLQDYRRYIMREMRGRGISVPDDWMLEVEMPHEDWIDAVRHDQIARNGSNTGTTYNTEWLKDDEGPMRGRRMAVYGGIKCYFNESPIRGYFKKVATTGAVQYRFVRVYDWINQRDEEGGLVVRANHDYDKDTIEVDGVLYPMITLIPHVDPRSFKRYGLIKPLKPIGGSNAGVNYEVRVIEGAKLQCNDFDDKFKLAARHEFRFKSIYPEISGFIAYRHSQRTGYVIDVTARNYGPGTDAFVAPEQFRSGAPDGCQTAECAQCDQVSGLDGQCVEDTDLATTTVGLAPAGAVNVAFRGAAATLKLYVERTTESEGAIGEVSVDYASTTGTGGDTATATSGTLTWAAGDTEPKVLEIPILATADDADTLTMTLSNAVGCTIKTGAAVTTATIVDLS